MSTSGSRIGTRPCARTCLPHSNCWAAIALMPAGLGVLDNRALLRPVDALSVTALREERGQGSGTAFISCTPFASAGEALVDLEDRNNSFVLPQESGGGLAVDLAVHGLLEKDRCDDPVGR